jgi:hypothetical protein
MIMTNFTQRSKLVNFFQTTDFSNTDINFSNISLMFVQIFQKLFQQRKFLLSLSEYLSIQVCVFQRKQKLINSNQNKKQKANENENANKNKIFT